MYIPQRQDFIWLNFDPQAGHEQMGKRPALAYRREAPRCTKSASG
jgi:mRNA interferase MazF